MTSDSSSDPGVAGGGGSKEKTVLMQAMWYLLSTLLLLAGTVNTVFLRLPRASCNLYQATALVAKDREAEYQQLVESGPCSGWRQR